MSHIAVRMLADRLEHPDEGLNAVLDRVPIAAGDQSAPEVRIYNETQHGWVARRQFPQPSEMPLTDVEYPCIVVYLASLTDVAGIAAVESTNARTTTGTLQVIAQLLMQNVDTEDGVTGGVYILRALRGVIHRYNAPEELERRWLAHTQLDAAIAIIQGTVNAFVDDSVFSPGAIIVTYPFKETVPLT